MATVAQFDQDQNNQNQPGQNPGGGGQVLNSTGGGGASSSGGGAAPAGQGTYSAPRQAQSGAPNINQYLQANQGAGQQLAGGITSNIQNQANQLNQNVNTAQSSLQNQYQPLQQNLGDKSQSTIQTAFQNPQQLLDAYNQSKTQSGNAPLSNDQQGQLDQYNNFQNLNTGGYNQAISNYGTTAQQLGGNLQNQYQNLAQQTGQANNEMGRNQLLQNTVGQPGYNQGQQTLDTLFLQAQPGVANQLKQNLGQIGSQAQQQVQNFGTDAQSKLAALQGLSSQDQQSIKNLFTNGAGGSSPQGLNGIASNVGNEYAAAQAASANNPQVAADFAKGQLSPDEMSKLGLDPNQKVWDLFQASNPNKGQLASYVNQNALDQNVNGVGAGNAQVAGADEFGRYNALNSLLGNNGSQNNIFGGAAAAGGGYNPYSLDTQRYNDAIANRAQFYQQEDPRDIARQVQGTINSNGTFGSAILPGVSQGLAGITNSTGNVDMSQLQNIINNAVSKQHGETGQTDTYQQTYNQDTGVGPNQSYLSSYLTPLQQYINQYGQVSNQTLGGTSQQAAPSTNSLVNPLDASAHGGSGLSPDLLKNLLGQ